MKHKVVLAAIAALIVMQSYSFGKEAKRDRYLLLDDRIIEKVENAVLKVGKVEKHPGNPLFAETEKWESRFDNMEPNVIYDEEEKIFKLWYGMFIRDAKEKPPQDQWKTVPYRAGGREDGVCYATSKDGLKWEKTEVGIIEFEGSKKNNIISRGEHGAGVFKDTNEKDPAKRYKMVFKRGRKMWSKFSSDGLNWGEPSEMYKYDDKHGDTHNHALWCPDQEKYVMITRLWTAGRTAGRSESSDFANWSMPEEVMRGGRIGHIYTLPTFYYAGVYIGMPVIYLDDRPYPELAWSPDTKTWNRIDEGTPFISRAEKEFDMDWGCIYPAVAPIVMPDRTIRIYYLASNWFHRRWRDGFWALATLRPDGWAGFEQESDEKPAVVTTRAVPGSGKVRVTADVEEGGSVMVTVMDEDGSKLKTDTITKTVTDKPLSSVKEFKGEKIKLRFELEKAKVYSFSFAD